jgi:hypothetical protein
MDRNKFKEQGHRISQLTSQVLLLPHDVLAQKYAALSVLNDDLSGILDQYQTMLDQSYEALNKIVQQSSNVPDQTKKLVETIVELTKTVEDAGRMGFKIAAQKASELGRKKAIARHEQGKFAERKAELIKTWLEGKYATKTRCAEKECMRLAMSFDTARKTLRNVPNPKNEPLHSRG